MEKPIKPITKPALFIQDLEKPQAAITIGPGPIHPGKDKEVTTLSLGEEDG